MQHAHRGGRGSSQEDRDAAGELLVLLLSALPEAEPVVNAAATAAAVACAYAMAAPSKSGSARRERSESLGGGEVSIARAVEGCTKQRQQVFFNSHVAASRAVAEREFREPPVASSHQAHART